MVPVAASPIGIQCRSSHLHRSGDLYFTRKISCHQPVQLDVTQHTVQEHQPLSKSGLCATSSSTKAERWINNGNYFKTNWKQKAQPSSVTVRQKGKPQKEEISAFNILSTPVSSPRQIFFYLSCSSKSSLKNSYFQDSLFYISWTTYARGCS